MFAGLNPLVQVVGLAFQLEIDLLGRNDFTRYDQRINLGPKSRKYIRWILPLPAIKPTARIHAVWHGLRRGLHARPGKKLPGNLLKMLQLHSEVIYHVGTADRVALIAFQYQRRERPANR